MVCLILLALSVLETLTAICSTFVTREETNFGLMVRNKFIYKSLSLLRINDLKQPASEADSVPPEDATVANMRLKLAPGLRADYVTRNTGSKGDMMVFGPSEDSYIELVICNEYVRSDLGDNPGMQRIFVETGHVDIIAFAIDRSDGVRTIAWSNIYH
ncbi:unnamed protein product [Agarophyton chilense]